MLGAFRFCPSCGGNILANASTSSPLPSPGLTPPGALNNKPSLKAAESKSVPSFEEFKRRKSEDRISKGKTTKKQKKAPSDVLINIGIMNMVKGVLKPIRSKVLMIKVPVEARKLDIVSKGVDKHSAHDRLFNGKKLYTLAYPDGSEVLTLPGNLNEIFQLDKYKEDLGKPYNRVTLYLVARSQMELLRHEGSSVSSGSESLSDSPKRELNAPQQSQIDSNQRIVETDSASGFEKAVTNETKPGVQQTSANVNVSVLRPREFHHLKEMFPTKSFQELQSALQTCQSMEDAVSCLISDNGSSGSGSIHDTYAALLGEDLSIEEEADDDIIILPDPGELSDQDSSTYSSNETLQQKVTAWRAKELNSKEYLRLKVRRQHIWQDTLFKLERTKPNELKKSLKIQFIGEPAVDQGGPSREFFTLINQHAQVSLMSEGLFRHNVPALQRNEFYYFGCITALGLMQGSSGPRCFSKSVVGYILGEKIQDVRPTIDEVADPEVRKSMENLDKITDEGEFKDKASFESDFRFEAGFTKPYVTMQEKKEFFNCVSLHYTLLSSLSELSQFIDGLKTCNILTLIREFPNLFRPVFQRSHDLTAELLDEMFQPKFSPDCSNRQAVEQNIMFHFNNFLEDVEKGKITCDINHEEVTLTLNQVLQFVTGAVEIPAIGFTPRPSIEFLHLEQSRKISASTCSNTLKIPVNTVSCDYNNFCKEFTFCIMNCAGFGLI